MTDLEFLVAVRAKIDTPEKWCKGVYVSSDGRCCLMGAARFVYGVKSDIETGPRLQRLLKIGQLACDFNDESTHGQVIDRIDDAIYRERTRVSGA